MYEWDDEKAAANLDKHGVSFQEAASAAEDAPLFLGEDNRRDYGERRFLSIGISRMDRIVTWVWTRRNGKTRLISARLASRRERQIYAQANDAG